MNRQKYEKQFIILSFLKNQVIFTMYLNDFWLDGLDLDK